MGYDCPVKEGDRFCRNKIIEIISIQAYTIYGHKCNSKNMQELNLANIVTVWLLVYTDQLLRLYYKDKSKSNSTHVNSLVLVQRDTSFTVQETILKVFINFI